MPDPISLVSKLADCGDGYSFAVVEDEEGNQHQAIIDLNAEDDTVEPRALVISEDSQVTAIGDLSEEFVTAYNEAPETTGNHRGLFCHDLETRLEGMTPAQVWLFPVPRLLDESRASLASSFSGLSIAPKMGFGFITDGALLDFNSSFPHGLTRLIGGEITFDFDRLVNGVAAGRNGELALVYFWGYAQEEFDESNLPLSDEPILPELQALLGVEDGEAITASDLLQFSSNREANSHFAFIEWRWPSNAAAYQSRHWTLIHPRFGLGGGVAYYNTQLIQGATVEDGDADGGTSSATDVEHSKTWHAFATGTTRVNLIEFRSGDFESVLGGGVRVFAGMLFGMTGEGDLRFTWRFDSPIEF